MRIKIFVCRWEQTEGVVGGTLIMVGKNWEDTTMYELKEFLCFVFKETLCQADRQWAFVKCIGDFKIWEQPHFTMNLFLL